MEQLSYYKKFHDTLTKQVQKEFNLNLQDSKLRKFIIKKFKRFVPIQLFVEKYSKTKKIENTTSTGRIDDLGNFAKSGGESQIGDISMTMNG